MADHWRKSRATSGAQPLPGSPHGAKTRADLVTPSFVYELKPIDFALLGFVVAFALGTALGLLFIDL